MQEKEEAIQKKFELSATQIIKNLQSRKFEAYYCRTAGRKRRRKRCP
jgi:hypothetical protein